MIVPLYKEGDRESATNYRGITLLSNVGKIFAGILERRLASWCEQKKIFEQEQAGFRKGRTTTDQIFTLAEIIHRRKKEKKPTFCCFLDIKKAYDTVWREGLWSKLAEVGVNGKMLLTIRSMYDGVKSSVIVNGRLTAWFDIDIGLRQGCVLSPLLFLIFVNDLIKEFKKSDTGVLLGEVRINNLAFADDIVLTANDEDFKN